MRCRSAGDRKRPCNSQIFEFEQQTRQTTIKIEIPASDRDETNGLSIEDVVLYNDGKTFQAKKVDAIWGDNSIVILQFEKLTAFEDCTLSFSLNGEPVSLDIQSCLADRK